MNTLISLFCKIILHTPLLGVKQQIVNKNLEKTDYHRSKNHFFIIFSIYEKIYFYFSSAYTGLKDKKDVNKYSHKIQL